jgi:hypothetical protein
MNFADTLVYARRWLSPEPAFQASPDDRENVRRLAAAAREHLSAARASADQRLFGAAGTLYGHAIAVFLEAKGLIGGPSNPGHAGAADFVSSSPFGSTEAGRDAICLLRAQPIEGTRAGRRRRAALMGLDGSACALGSLLYPATEAEVQRLRARRRIAVGSILAIAALTTGLWVVAPRNLARGKPVTASSIRFGTPQALVNGAIEWGTFGLHTGGGRAWATIDLEDFFSLSSAEIFGRGDGHVEAGLPLAVDLSDDGVTFRPAGSCTDIFTQATPCVVNLDHQRARFVRVAASEIVLSEVEVFGSR